MPQLLPRLTGVLLVSLMTGVVAAGRESEGARESRDRMMRCDHGGPRPVRPLTAAAEQPRVRPGSIFLATSLLGALQRSPTLRMLVDDLQARDVIVYLVWQPLLRDRIGMVQWIAKAGGLRYVQASIGPAYSPAALMSAVAHELQHAREIAETPSIADAATFARHYRSIGERVQAHGEAWETPEAYAIGERVHREMAATPLQTPVATPARPIDWFAVYRCERSLWARAE